MNWKSWKIWLVAAALGLAGGAIYIKAQSAAAIAVVHPVRGPAVQAVYATGTVEPVVMLPLAPRATGRLMSLLADEGHEVEKGAVLARLEDENVQKNLAELQARAALAEKEYERRAALVERGVISKEAADQALADRDAARAAAERVQAEIDFLKLTAPEAGTIIRRDGEIGEVIPAGQPVFWMSCCHGLRIEAEVDEEDIALVKPGQKVVVHADAFPDKVFSGTLTSITPKGDPVSRSYRVRIGLAPDSELMIGMTAETNIIIREEQNALLVPASALTDDGKIMIVTGGIAESASVEAGARTPEVAEIRAGLSENELVVLDAAEVKAGETVDTVLTKWKAP